ncbi:MAG TPA: serine hydrolase [Longimicrobiales bacterium]|nr:serine hydrolase [Longimicrobiales bacterium]
MIRRDPARPGAGLLFCFAFFFAAAPALAQRPDPAALDRYIAGAIAAWEVPGLAVAIVEDGRTVLARGYGVRETGTDARADEHTLFAIASNTKAFTVAALAMLVDEGKLDWDDRVRDHLPWFELYDPYVSAEMRIRDLLSHRSGLGTFSGDLLWYGTPYSPEEVVRRTRLLPAAGPFRASYGYSNLMFIAAGEVVRAASGKPWEQFVRERILDPLGMRRTVLSTDALAQRDNVATPHKTWAGTSTPIPWQNWNTMGAAGSIISSVSDMAEWLKLQLGGGVTAGGDTLFAPAQQWTMWTMHTPQAVPASSRELYPSTNFRGYALGWALNDYLGRRIVSHGGGYDGMYSRVVLVPEAKLGMVVLTNSMTGISTAITNRILDAYLGGEERDWSALLLERERRANTREAERRAAVVRQTVAGTRPSLPLDAYAGTYVGAMYGDATVTLEDGGLVLRLLPNPELVADLRHLQFDTFVVEWRRTWAWFESGVAQFILDPAGKVVEVELNVPNQDLWFDELELKKR